MRSILLYVLIIIAGSSFLISCKNSNDVSTDKTKSSDESKSSATKEENEIAFYINDRPVYKHHLTSNNLDTSINDEVIYEIGLQKNLDKDQDIMTKVELFKKNLVTSKLKFDIIKDYLANNPVSDDDVNSYYNEVKDKYARLDLTLVMLPDEKTANEVYSVLTKSTDVKQTLEEQKKAVSDIVVKDISGMRNYDKYFDKMEAGSISKPIKGENKFSIYIINDINYVPLERIAQQLRYQLMSKNRAKAVNEYVKTLISNNEVKVKRVN